MSKTAQARRPFAAARWYGYECESRAAFRARTKSGGNVPEFA